jgi:hypothetical protein
LNLATTTATFSDTNEHPSRWIPPAR